MTASGTLPGLCRNCGNVLASLPDMSGQPGHRCLFCRSPRLVFHPELHDLSLAHIDCDAFYAAVEKRDRPELADKPVIIGGGTRGVVSAACYVARLYGVRSAMPMFKALRACPEAVVIRPDMAKYQAAGKAVRRLMLETTPLVQAISIDEAFLDLAGTERLHGGSAARTLASLALRIERDLGITVSIGLSYNKFLAKLASDLDKPRGFKVIGRAEAVAFLRDRPVEMIWGVGRSLQDRLAKDGIRLIGQLQQMEERDLMRRYDSMGRRLWSFARGIDPRPVDPVAPAKSISAETTFARDLDAVEALKRALWPLCETVARRLKAAGLAGTGVVLKLKTADFRQITRSRQLQDPAQLADTIYQAALPLLVAEATGERYRLIGIGASGLSDPRDADPPDLLDPGKAKRKRVEQAIDAVRSKLGQAAIGKGRGFPS